jgi:hypothetical protein
VVLVDTNIGVEHAASIFRAEGIGSMVILKLEIPSALKVDTVMVSPYNTTRDETHKTTT